MPELKGCKNLSRASLLIAANLLFALSFIICKMVILVKTGKGLSVPFSYYAADIFVTICLSFLVCISYRMYLAGVAISLVYYLINCHLAMIQGFFFDLSVAPLLLEVKYMRDSIFALAQVDIFLIVFALILMNIFFTKRLSCVIDRFVPFVKLIPTVLLLLGLLVFAGRFSGKSGLYSTNPIAFLGNSIAIDMVWSINDMNADVSLDFDYGSRFPGESPEPAAFKSVPKDEKYNLVVLLLESTGSETIGQRLGEVMPNFHKLCQDGVYFNNCYASCPISIKSIFSLHTGQYPAADKLSITRVRPRIPVNTLAVPFKERGYKTALLHGGFFAFFNKHKFLRFRGYDVLHDAKTMPGKERYEQTSWGVDDRSVYEYAKQWIGQDDSPFMLTIIPILPHHPYNIPGDVEAKFGNDSQLDKYFNSVYFQDTQIGGLVSYLKEKGRYEKTVFVVVGDHAEAFNQHEGNTLHSFNLYEENIKVPLLISNPLLFPQPQECEIPAILPDVFPTVVELFGMGDHTCQGDGMSLFSPRKNRMLFYYTFHKGEKLGVRDGKYKFIHFKEEQRVAMYDLSADGKEQVDISADFPERVNYYKSRVEDWKAYTKSFVKNVGNEKVEVVQVSEKQGSGKRKE